MRRIEITRKAGRWWSAPWTAWLYEGDHLLTLACGMTRSGALRDLRRRERAYDKAKPKIILRERVPYEKKP